MSTTTTLKQLEDAQESPEIPINENFETLSFLGVYGKRQPATSGLTWGYYGGLWGGFDIADDDLALTGSQTNYIVVAIATGIISVSTTNTNWNNTTDYVRVYKITTSVSAVTAVEDHRAGPGGVASGAGGALGSVDASDVQITNTDQHYAGQDVGQAIDDLYDTKAADGGTVTPISSSAGVVNLNLALGDYFTFALSENVTSITFSNLPGASRGATVAVLITQDSSPRTVAWPASFKWAGAVAGAVSTGSGAVDMLAISTFDNGTTWHATLSNARA